MITDKTYKEVIKRLSEADEKTDSFCRESEEVSRAVMDELKLGVNRKPHRFLGVEDDVPDWIAKVRCELPFVEMKRLGLISDTPTCGDGKSIHSIYVSSAFGELRAFCVDDGNIDYTDDGEPTCGALDVPYGDLALEDMKGVLSVLEEALDAYCQGDFRVNENGEIEYDEGFTNCII